jgi:hypothetical protein
MSRIRMKQKWLLSHIGNVRNRRNSRNFVCGKMFLAKSRPNISCLRKCCFSAEIFAYRSLFIFGGYNSHFRENIKSYTLVVNHLLSCKYFLKHVLFDLYIGEFFCCCFVHRYLKKKSVNIFLYSRTFVCVSLHWVRMYFHK